MDLLKKKKMIPMILYLHIITVVLLIFLTEFKTFIFSYWTPCE